MHLSCSASGVFSPLLKGGKCKLSHQDVEKNGIVTVFSRILETSTENELSDEKVEYI
jgi:hypothetical protein